MFFSSFVVVTRLGWTGDINADFRRNMKFVRLINKFIFELDISKSWDIHEIDFTHACEVNGVTHASIIAHLFGTRRLMIV